MMFPPAVSNISVLLAAEPSTIRLNIMVALLIAFVMLLLSSKTRTVAAIRLGSLLVLLILGLFAWRIFEVHEVSRANPMAQFNLPQPAVRISQNNDWNNKVRVAIPDFQLENQTVGQPANHWPNESQTPSFAAATSTRPTWFAFGVLAIFGLLLLGGLAFTVAMISIPKTRTLGIVLLVVGSIIILPIIAGLFWFGSSYSPAPTATESQSSWTTQTIQPPGSTIPLPPGYGPPGSAIPLPPGYSPQAPMPQPSQSQPDNTPEPNSKQIVQAYESAIQYYCKAIAQPLKLEKTEILSEKVSTLHINFQDIGHVTISGSSFLINSIGQALAKAMTDRMKEANPQMDITPENSTKVASDAAPPVNNVSEQPASAKASLKKDISAKESPFKDASAATAKTPAPIANAVIPASSVTTVSAEPMITPDAPELPDWVGKQPFVWRAGKGAELPDYYKIVRTKPMVGDAYVMSVSTDPYTTIQECEAKIPEVIQSAVNQFVERNPGLQRMGNVQLSPEQLRQLVVAEYEELWQSQSLLGKMPRIHLLLNFDQKATELIADAMNVRLFTDRACVAGTGFIGLWLLLAVIWGYLKLDLATKGAYRKRLQAAAAFAILIIVTIGLLALRSLA
jgi:hypothetical protein